MTDTPTIDTGLYECATCSTDEYSEGELFEENQLRKYPHDGSPVCVDCYVGEVDDPAWRDLSPWKSPATLEIERLTSLVEKAKPMLPDYMIDTPEGPRLASLCERLQIMARAFNGKFGEAPEDRTPACDAIEEIDRLTALTAKLEADKSVMLWTLKAVGRRVVAARDNPRRLLSAGSLIRNAIAREGDDAPLPTLSAHLSTEIEALEADKAEMLEAVHHALVSARDYEIQLGQSLNGVTRPLLIAKHKAHEAHEGEKNND